MAQPIGPGTAMTESGTRTVVDLATGFLLTLVTGFVVQAAADNNVILTDEAAGGIVFSFWTIVSAVVKRKFWPTKTDAIGVGRTDVTAGGKPI